MTTSERVSKLRSTISSRSRDSAKALILDVNNIQSRLRSSRRHLQSVLHVDIRNVRTVRQLREAIVTQHNLTVQEVLYRGVSLRDYQQLAYLLPTMTKIGHSPRFSVRTTFVPSDDMILLVKDLCKNKYQIHLPPHSTIGDLRECVREETGIPESLTRLYTSDHQLWTLDDNLPLSSLNIVSWSVVRSILLMRGGASVFPSKSFVDMENRSSLKTFQVTYSGTSKRPGRSLCRGLNVRGKCRNVKCDAYGGDVYCHRGFTVFNIAEPVRCPSCNEEFNAVTCGFLSCEWMFEGRKPRSGVDIMSEWNVAKEDEFQEFDDEEGRNTTDWSSLAITTKPLVSCRTEDRKTEDCVLCYGLTNPPSGTSQNGTCGHAVHAECVRAFRKGGYSNCPTCRLPLGPGTED